MPRNPATKSPTPVAAHKHKDKRANIPTEELRDFVAGDGHASSPSPRDEGVGRGPGRGASDNLLNLILECTGEKKKDKEAKVATAKTFSIPAANGHGEFGRWDFLEISDPWDAENAIRARFAKAGG